MQHVENLANERITLDALRDKSGLNQVLSHASVVFTHSFKVVVLLAVYPSILQEEILHTSPVIPYLAEPIHDALHDVRLLRLHILNRASGFSEILIKQ